MKLIEAHNILRGLLVKYCEASCNCDPRWRMQGKHAKDCPANNKNIAPFERALNRVNEAIIRGF